MRSTGPSRRVTGSSAAKMPCADVAHLDAQAIVVRPACEVGALAGREVVEHDDAMAALDQPIDGVRADEAGAAGDGDERQERRGCGHGQMIVRSPRHEGPRHPDRSHRRPRGDGASSGSCEDLASPAPARCASASRGHRRELHRHLPPHRPLSGAAARRARHRGRGRRRGGRRRGHARRGRRSRRVCGRQARQLRRRRACSTRRRSSGFRTTSTRRVPPRCCSRA